MLDTQVMLIGLNVLSLSMRLTKAMTWKCRGDLRYQTQTKRESIEPDYVVLK